MHRDTVWRLTIYFLLFGAFFLGLPQIHYTVAVMVAVILRHKDQPLNEPLF